MEEEEVEEEGEGEGLGEEGEGEDGGGDEGDDSAGGPAALAGDVDAGAEPALESEVFSFEAPPAGEDAPAGALGEGMVTMVDAGGAGAAAGGGALAAAGIAAAPMGNEPAGHMQAQLHWPLDPIVPGVTAVAVEAGAADGTEAAA